MDQIVQLPQFTLMFALIFVILGGCVGVPYTMVVTLVGTIVALVAKKLGKTPSPTLVDLVVVALPIATYIGLTWLVEDRQALNWYRANLMVAVPVGVGLVMRPWIPARWRVAWAIPVTLSGMAVAFWAWRVVPVEPLGWRMF